MNSQKVMNGSILGLDVADDTLTGAQIDESTLTGLPASNAWSLIGNSGTGPGDFLGTTDNQPLDFRVNDARALRLEPASDGTNPSPNVIGGSARQLGDAGRVRGHDRRRRTRRADAPETGNRVTDHLGWSRGGANNQAGDGAGTVGDATLATIGGGGNNVATAEAATVGGGIFNTASGFHATVPGGDNNRASGNRAVVVGGSGNVASGASSAVLGGVRQLASADLSLAAGVDAQRPCIRGRSCGRTRGRHSSIPPPRTSSVSGRRRHPPGVGNRFLRGPELRLRGPGGHERPLGVLATASRST